MKKPKYVKPMMEEVYEVDEQMPLLVGSLKATRGEKAYTTANDPWEEPGE